MQRESDRGERQSGETGRPKKYRRDKGEEKEVKRQRDRDIGERQKTKDRTGEP